MKTVTQYWNLVRLDSAGNTKITEIVRAKELFIQQFPELIDKEEASNTVIQNDLVALKNERDETVKIWSNRCLRCFISHQIKQICVQLEMQFGREHDFTRSDLFIYTLNDTLDNFRDSITQKERNSKYKPLAVEVLEKFEPKKATLSTWTTRIVKQHREVQRFLLERGVYLISNWAILNDTNTKQVKRILAQFHNLTPLEIAEATILLESYHDVYRRDRLTQNRGRGEKCQTPSKEQLDQIATLIQQKSKQYPSQTRTGLRSLRQSELSVEQTLFNLEQLAGYLREYRIHVRGGSFKQKSLDNSELNTNSLQASIVTDEERDSDRHSFLESYQQQFQSSLKQAIAEVIAFKLSKFKGKKARLAPQYLTALELFHCQNKAMSEIASIIGLQAQYQVTRLLKLKELRADIRQKMLQIMGDWTLSQSQKFSSPETLKERELAIAEALAEQVDGILTEAEKEANVAGSNRSILAKRICDHLDTASDLM
jgi:hypothetical protein